MKYTYSDWWSGKIFLLYCKVNYGYHNSQKKVGWDSIKSDDIQKIKNKQKELFEKGKNTLLKTWTEGFTTRYEVSKEKKQYLSEEIRICEFNLGIEVDSNAVRLNKHLPYSSQELNAIRDYYKDTIIDGNERGFDYMHSPQCPIPHPINPPQVIAIVYYEYLNWLKENQGNNNKEYNSKADSLPPPPEPLGFSDIFNSNWKKYIMALTLTKPPLLNYVNGEFEFIGVAKKHKGVVCGWIRKLRSDGIIRQSVNRIELAEILNNEIKNLNLGVHGRSFSGTVSKLYEEEFKADLIKNAP